MRDIGRRRKFAVSAMAFLWKRLFLVCSIEAILGQSLVTVRKEKKAYQC